MPYLNKHWVTTLFWGLVVFQGDKMFQAIWFPNRYEFQAIWFVPLNNYQTSNKKVLLCERKRHTARKRAQDADPPSWTDPPHWLTPPAVLTWPPLLAGLTPPSWTDLTPPASWTNLTPPPQLDWPDPPPNVNRLKTLPSPILRMRAVITWCLFWYGMVPSYYRWHSFYSNQTDLFVNAGNV